MMNNPYVKSTGVDMDDKIVATPVVEEAQVSPYDALGLQVGCTADDVTKAYRRLSLRWHPDRNFHNRAVAERRFKEIGDSYQALIDPETGDLRQKVEWDWKPEVYMMEGMHKSTHTMALKVTLEELFTGCTKTREIRRGRMVAGDMQYEKKTISVPIMPGWRPGTKIIYPNQGDQVAGGQLSDLVFDLQLVPHSLYRRCGDDIEHRHTLTGKAEVLRLPSLHGHEVGEPVVPLVGYANILSELSTVAVTLVKTHPVPDMFKELIKGKTDTAAYSGEEEGWATPLGKGIKLKDKGMTVTRVRMPGALQAVITKRRFEGRDGFHSIAWKVNKAGDEAVVGFVPPNTILDRRFSNDTSRRWGLLWNSDGNIYNLGSGKARVKTDPWAAGDILQMSIHVQDNQTFLFKNQECVYRSGHKIEVSTEGRKEGDVATFEGEGMPVLKGNKVVGRGDLQVYFQTAKARPAPGVATQEETGSSRKLEEWLVCRKHPKPKFAVDSFEGKYKASLKLVQTRPFPTEGSFDGVSIIGKAMGSEDAAKDNVALKALKLLERLAQQHPDVHRVKVKSKASPSPSPPPALDDGSPPSKRAKLDETPPPPPPAFDTATDDID